MVDRITGGVGPTAPRPRDEGQRISQPLKDSLDHMHLIGTIQVRTESSRDLTGSVSYPWQNQKVADLASQRFPSS